MSRSLIPVVLVSAIAALAVAPLTAQAPAAQAPGAKSPAARAKQRSSSSVSAAASGTGAAAFTVVEASIPEMQKAMADRRVTSRALVVEYLTRIARYQDRLHAVMAVNPKAIEEAEQLDRERAQGKLRGPLHGVPIALKDNIHTLNLPTTGGAIAFEGFRPPYEATLTMHLREAGAIIIAKSVLTELANWVAGGPTPMPGNYNALAGFGMNPYDPRRDPRPDTSDGRPVMQTGGSSSGIGTSANLWAANVGTETSGSILSPANQTMLVGIKPTVGRISRYGVIPITADQDTAGPMTKSVTDAAIMLGVLEGAAPDSHDPATRACTPPPRSDYTAFLKRDGLKGARIGIPRAFFFDKTTPAGDTNPRGGLNAEQAALMAEVIATLTREGAIIVDPADIPSIVEPDPAKNFLKWNTCSGVESAKGKDEACSVVLKYGMKRDFNAWLATLGPAAPVKTLAELRAFNTAHAASRGAIKFGQSQLDISDEMDVEADRARYEADRAKDVALGGTQGLDAAMKANRLDALLFPGASGAAIAAKPGYPTVIVPAGLVPNAPPPTGKPFPADFAPLPQPYGVSFTGLACSEPKLIAIAYAFEQASHRRVPPPSAP
jgi:amidase